MSDAVYIVGSGAYLPGRPIPAAESEAILGDLPDAPAPIRRWLHRSAPVMRELLDIEFFHYAMDPVTREFTDDNVTMSVKAAQQALDAAGMDAEDIDLICYGSAHQDQMPTASVRIQEALGVDVCDELSIHANCTSAYKALYLAHQLLRAGQNRRALVLSSNVSSSELRAEYYNQPLVDKESLFLRWFLSDGAGALVLSANGQQPTGLVIDTTYIESIGGSRAPLMYNERPALWLSPKEEWDQGRHHLKQRFRNALSSGVFQEGGQSVFARGFERMLDSGGIDPATIALMQINLPTKHIVESVIDELAALGIERSAIYSKLAELGYSGPPMVFICLDRILREESLAPGARVASFVTEVSKFMQAGYVLRQL